MKCRATQSLCPVCLRRVNAIYEDESGEAESGDVFLTKTCPEHGRFTTLVWRGSGFSSWSRPKIPACQPLPETAGGRGCPYDCGLCPEHGQHTCTALVEVTSRCNLRCPLCYADAGGNGALTAFPEPALAELQSRLVDLRRHAGRCNLQLSGGEPTVRDDLPQIVAAARDCDFGLIQINTNGLRLAEPGFAAGLREAGLDSVYLQWDGLDAAVFTALRGRDLLAEKQAALAACEAAGLGVVLVMTMLAGVNQDKLGHMLRFAVQSRGVRGLHIQPAAFFGRYPGTLADRPRLTLPDIMTGLAIQSDGLVQRTDFHPPGCEHALCSFSAVYSRDAAGGLTLIQGESACCGPDSPSPALPPASAEDGARKARAFVAGHWKGPADSAKGNPDQADFGRFLSTAGAAQRFTLSAMAFQDVLSLDLERVRGCCIHVSTPDGRRIPFCLYNLTSIDGIPLYRGR